ncbi:MAG TPA: proline--tRNA ligase [Actinomycetota bacterium]|jgi:prolyl-tRNA synthetase|nr:proline--tRNA ligase [Actinomycetota bacterium]
MRLSVLFARTLREDPADAEVPSHKLLLRGAFVRKLMAGVYTTMPLGLRVMRKIERIVREEMDAAGAQELRMPITVPAEPWKQTGRWDAYGDELFRLRDRHERDMLLGPTQEEVVTPLVASEFPSYRDLPVNVYQVEWKYRDELRPRYGLLRGREFLMKDAYSFDRDEDGLGASYEVMYGAYERVFVRCRLEYVIVEADPGTIGGGVNHEYMAIADVGEDVFVRCANGDYLADTEAATPRAPAPLENPGLEPLEEVPTPGAATIEAVVAQLGVDPSQTLKCMLFDVGGSVVAVVLPGDREVNERKLARLYFPSVIRRFEDADFASHGLAKGFVGPQGLPDAVTILADLSVRGGSNWVTGANRVDVHVRGANADRDFRVDRYEDLVQIREGDVCPKDGGELHLDRSIVVGHIFQLGTYYSEPLRAAFVDEDGAERFYQMGCYGIGISRVMAAAAEQYHDDAGLRWPRALAPYEVAVILANQDDPRVIEEAERIYRELVERGVEAVLDDREDRAGVKFADADLVGYPVQVVVGKKGVAAGTVDLKLRATGDRSTALLAGATGAIVDLLARAP